MTRAPDMNMIRQGREALKPALAAIGRAVEQNGNLAGASAVFVPPGGRRSYFRAGLFRRSAVGGISRGPANGMCG